MKDYNKDDIKKHLEWYFMNEGEISHIECVPKENEYDQEDHIRFRLTADLADMDLPAKQNQATNITSGFSFTIRFGIEQIFWQAGKMDGNITSKDYDNLVELYQFTQNEIPPHKSKQH